MKCRGCGVEIAFLRLGPQRPVPVEVVQRETVLEDGRKVRVFVNHFCTCPAAKQFSRGPDRRGPEAPGGKE